MNSKLLFDFSLIELILLSNGLYDIICCVSILTKAKYLPFSHLAELHFGMFKVAEIENKSKTNKSNNHKNQLLVKRLIAYWVGTYGLVRTMSGFSNEIVLNYIGAATYFIEAFAFAHEYYVGSMIKDKTLFVIISSFILGIVVLMR